ncbi:NAD(P)-binding protein [Ophiobolus disseminans]|uniref:NAD(P)-binding protein n=1 Tax=Ophiobolus disseminans TaxID=1469910 RepID=A0A6A7A0U6_9PLEO|nr:NAD(P)-binding protein [Ophiobolus disseminans]
MTKLITVFGATGNQGGSVVRAVLEHPVLSKEWRVRGITRNKSRPDAMRLVGRGVEMVEADLNSKDSILNAIQGSDAVFGVTNYWEKASLDHEVQQGHTLTSACLAASIPHLIWSSLPHVSKITHGKLHNLHHFDSKALVEEYIVSVGQPATFVMPAYFMSNIPGGIKKTENSEEYTLSWMFKPDTQIPMLDVPRDFGKFVASALIVGPSSQHVLASSGWFTPTDVCAAVEGVTGKKCVFSEIPVNEFGGSKELFDNLMMIREYEYYGPGAKDGVERSQSGVKEVGGWEEFGTFEGYLRGVGFGEL